MQEINSSCRSCRSVVCSYVWERCHPHAHPWPCCSSLKNHVEQEQQISTLTSLLHPSPQVSDRVQSAPLKNSHRNAADTNQTLRRRGGEAAKLAAHSSPTRSGSKMSTKHVRDQFTPKQSPESMELDHMRTSSSSLWSSSWSSSVSWNQNKGSMPFHPAYSFRLAWLTAVWGRSHLAFRRGTNLHLLWKSALTGPVGRKEYTQNFDLISAHETWAHINTAQTEPGSGGCSGNSRCPVMWQHSSRLFTVSCHSQ